MAKTVVKYNINFEPYTSLVNKYMNEALRIIGKLVIAEARAIHRFKSRTGNLEKQTKYRVDNKLNRLAVFISQSKAPYGEFIHDGTRYMAPDQFLSNAVAVVNKEGIPEKYYKIALQKAAKEFNRKNRL
jgi:hypothetical protein